jgi:hypothetical protein
MAFNENSRVKIPAILHLMRMGYGYIPVKQQIRREDTIKRLQVDAPDGKIQKSDVFIAKNYLSHQHIQELNRIVSAYLDLAENNAQRGMAFSMRQISG